MNGSYSARAMIDSKMVQEETKNSTKGSTQNAGPFVGSFMSRSLSQHLNELAFMQCWDYCHFRESECESLSYESESESTKA